MRLQTLLLFVFLIPAVLFADETFRLEDFFAQNGYNAKSNSIIYTDSWGKGHEKKTLPLNDAWTQTLMLIAVTPR